MEGMRAEMGFARVLGSVVCGVSKGADVLSGREDFNLLGKLRELFQDWY
jgi:hypothetical protein